jgi:hypothetical protein
LLLRQENPPRLLGSASLPGLATDRNSLPEPMLQKLPLPLRSGNQAVAQWSTSRKSFLSAFAALVGQLAGVGTADFTGISPHFLGMALSSSCQRR